MIAVISIALIAELGVSEAEDLDEAEKIARDNPHIASIRVYEIM